ncbi:PAS domain S-box protein [Niabella hibiscisoli]|uniref:PAS domain S-box protein n=1 Tax=Niabella hibiscisoli TaxID=1825928 RepID=UPI001F0E02DC|nr:PAS domain S-box protein [Niabella hibiscisoli]MCH5718773.1 PAS domain S-box protein [Niabella hibiscisoli]
MSESTPLWVAEERQALLAAIVDSSEDAIVSKTLEGIITSWNRAATTLFGYQESEATGKHISLIIPEDRLHEEDFIIHEIRNGRRIQHFQTIRRAKSGKEIPLSLAISPIKNGEGIVTGASKIARDISRQKEAAEKQGMLAAIVNNSDDAIVSKTLDGIITSWNNAAALMFGYKESEAIGRHISLIIPQERLAEEDYIIGEIKKGNSVSHFETIRVTRNGDFIPISLTVSPILNEEKTIIGASKIARDISEKIAAHNELEQLYQQVKSLSDKKDEFIAMTTHELKTPVTSLRGFLQLLQIHTDGGERNRLFVERSIKQVDKLTMLINDLVEFSKLQAGKLGMHFETFDLRLLIEECLDLYATNSNHSLKLYYSGSMEVSADRLRIEQVVDNLVSNAIKYSPQGGNVEIVLCGKSSSVEVQIKDEGIGISPEVLDKLFSQFFRAVEPGFNIPGLGMGLYITKEIIERHGGTINVESTPGKGSAFSFVLPRAMLPPIV